METDVLGFHATGRQRSTELLRRVARIDETATRQVLRVDSVTLDRALRLLSASADHSKLWLGIAGALAASRRPHLRAAAAEGLGSAAVASLVVNQGVKRAVPRRRPSAESMTVGRRLRRMPTSSSFPSGHAASALAFATAVALREPTTAIVLTPLAGAVGYSRIHTGAHFFSDVMVGSAVGVAVAVAVHRLCDRDRDLGDGAGGHQGGPLPR